MQSKIQDPDFNVRVSQCYRVKNYSNPVSGHEWIDHEVLQQWEVKGPLGVIAKVKSYEKALELQREQQAFYNKFFK